MTRTRLSRVVLAVLLIVSGLAPATAIAAGQETTSTAAPSSTQTTSQDVMNIVRGGPDVPESEARLVYDWLSTSDVAAELSETERQRVYRWLLRRQTQTDAHVPSRFVTQVGETMRPTVVETIREDVLPESTATPTPTPSPESSTNESASEEKAKDPVAIVDPNLQVVGFRYNASNEMFSIRFRNIDDRNDSTVTVTEVIDRDTKGSSKFGIVQTTIDAGETRWVHVSAGRVDGSAGVMITTIASVAAGEGTLIQESDDEKSAQLIKGGATGADVRAAGLSTGAATCLFILLGAWQFVAWKNGDVKPADMTPKLTIFGRFRE